jgi:hypothetical protein
VSLIGKQRIIEQTNFIHVFLSDKSRSFEFHPIMDSSGRYSVESSRFVDRKKAYVEMQKWMFNELPVDSIMKSCGARSSISSRKPN